MRFSHALLRSASVLAVASSIGMVPIAAQAQDHGRPSPGQPSTHPLLLNPKGVRPLTPHGLRPQNQTSPNWVGYAAKGGSYNSVESTWVQPAVDCSQGDGSAVFWVGLDGWGSSTVEQTGTEADCNGGQASYSAWWETYPDNPINSYSDPVSPGDTFDARVTYQSDGTYDIYITDQTQGWTEDNPQNGPQGASNASAEVVAETPGYGNNQFANLPDFGTVNFTNSTVNGVPIGNSNPTAIDLARNGSTLATTGPLSGGSNFTVTWQANS